MAKQYKYAISRAKEFDKLLKKSASEIMDRIGQDTVNKLKVYIRLYWYDRYSPTDYDRTYSLLNSVSYKVEGNTVKIYIDENKLIHATQSGWNQHMSFDGEDFSAGLIEFIENGRFDSGKTGTKTNPRIGKGSKAIEKTLRWLNKYINQEVKRQLSIVLGTKVF